MHFLAVFPTPGTKNQQFLLQVAVQWPQFLQCGTPASKPVLMLTLDETCLRFRVKPPYGVVARCGQRQSWEVYPFVPWKEAAQHLWLFFARTKLSNYRFLLPYCATHTRQHALHQHLVIAVSNTLRIPKVGSSWNLADVMCIVLDEVAQAVVAWKEVYQLDVAPCHTAQKVLPKVRTLQISCFFSTWSNF